MFRARIGWSRTEDGVLGIESQQGRNWMKYYAVNKEYFLPEWRRLFCKLTRISHMRLCDLACPISLVVLLYKLTVAKLIT
jgi:hypothetical protein